jgi:hypothetical protein
VNRFVFQKHFHKTIHMPVFLTNTFIKTRSQSYTLEIEPTNKRLVLWVRRVYLEWRTPWLPWPPPPGRGALPLLTVDLYAHAAMQVRRWQRDSCGTGKKRNICKILVPLWNLRQRWRICWFCRGQRQNDDRHGDGGGKIQYNAVWHLSQLIQNQRARVFPRFNTITLEEILLLRPPLLLMVGCWLLVAGLFWEKSTAGWWRISQTNRAFVSFFPDTFLLLCM